MAEHLEPLKVIRKLEAVPTGRVAPSLRSFKLSAEWHKRDAWEPDVTIPHDYAVEYRIEARVGACLFADQRELDNPEYFKHIRRSVAHLVLEELYGEVRHELIEALHDFAEEGVVRTPGTQRLERLLRRIQLTDL